MAWMISTIVLVIIIVIMAFILRNMLQKNEFMEDFIVRQDEAINSVSERLKQIDDQGIFESDDQIGWFWKEMMRIKEALDEFKLR
tara:strand:+ start:121 stop:375 length:255 start_codon:yes stop_codon:yes gene_type:complete